MVSPHLFSKSAKTAIRNQRSRNGFTLVEVVVSTLIAGALIVPALSVFGSIAQSYTSQARRSIATSLAQNLLSEIVQADFEDADFAIRVFGPEPDEASRADFEDVDDYDGLIESPPLNRQGVVIAGAEKFIVNVAVRYVPPAFPNATIAFETHLKSINVEVSGNGLIQPISFTALRTAQGVYEMEPGVESTMMRKINVKVGLGGSLNGVISGSNVINQLGESP